MAGTGCSRIQIRENNNLSKISMMCVRFPDGISMGLIHQALSWLGTRVGDRNTRRAGGNPAWPPEALHGGDHSVPRPCRTCHSGLHPPRSSGPSRALLPHTQPAFLLLQPGQSPWYQMAFQDFGVFLIFTYLKERGKDSSTHRLHSPVAHKSQGWARQTPGNPELHHGVLRG